jgi:prophage antirepressor-like protein
MENNINKIMIDKNSVVTYNNGEIELKVSIDNNKETIWLTQKQIVALFEKNQSVISRHINNIFKDGEVDDKSNMQKMHIANSDKPVNFYSLDIILAIGYRTNSKKAIEFRKWATKVLKEYIVNGYAINSEKITIDRFLHLENDMNNLKQKVNNINNLIDSNKLEIKQGIFYNGQIYDAYAFTNDLLKSAKKDIVLVDNYIDDTVLTLFSKYEKLHFTIVSKSINKQSKLDISKYNQQYNNLTIKTSNNFHDRFLLIDNKESYHLGASLKDLGKKVFGFSKMDISLFEIMKKLEENK